eukprot:3441791-Rhodomonas_salina.1
MKSAMCLRELEEPTRMKLFSVLDLSHCQWKVTQWLRMAATRTLPDLHPTESSESACNQSIEQSSLELYHNALPVDGGRRADEECNRDKPLTGEERMSRAAARRRVA